MTSSGVLFGWSAAMYVCMDVGRFMHSVICTAQVQYHLPSQLAYSRNGTLPCLTSSSWQRLSPIRGKGRGGWEAGGYGGGGVRSVGR